jgi:hypothetical protein
MPKTTHPSQSEGYLYAAVRVALSRGHSEIAAMLLECDIEETEFEPDYANSPETYTIDLWCPPEYLDKLAPLAVDQVGGDSYLLTLFQQVRPKVGWLRLVFVSAKQEHPEDDWREQLRQTIEGKATNQGRPLGNSKIVMHSGLNFRSQSEVAIAKAFDQSDHVLYFPDSAAVWHGIVKEPDFLVFYQGKVGILEVDGPTHTGRAAEDNTRDSFFQRSHIFVKHYTAEHCYGQPMVVVKDFLDLLRKS